ncbi:MAG: hypothetical protein HN333_09885, partial [Rhodospirillaceae bacterium]|nr:hypothetical protein [Rhodospirillaceae bacterium]
MGGYHTPPRIENLLLNTVAAANVTTFENTILGSCEGIPGETFGFPRGPVLPGEVIEVIEPEPPSEADARVLR